MREFDVREMLVPVILELVDDHCQHLGHRVVHSLHSNFAVWMVGARDNSPNPEKLLDDVRKL